MASRIYEPTYAGDLDPWTFGPGAPIGAGGLLPCVTTEGGAYVEFTQSSTGGGLPTLAWLLSYDGAVPPASVLTRMNCTYRYAGNAAFAPRARVADLGSYSVVQTVLPAVAVFTNGAPTEADWQTEVGVLSGPFSVSTLALNNYAFLFFYNNNLGDGQALYLDRCFVEIEFTLGTPTIPSGPSFFSTTRNSTKLSGLLSAAAGISNSTYPLTVRTRYTQSDPSSRAAQDDEIGQGQIFETNPQTAFSDDATARNIDFLDSITGLSPNTTYYAQIRCENADGDIVDSDWTSFTTRQFDTVLSF